ncbi:MAG: efflux RND transporter periplasmic adaptor subunit [Clostridiaceae bacterium]
MNKKVIWGSAIITIIAIVIGTKLILDYRNGIKKVKFAQAVQGEVKAYLSTSGTINSQNNKSYYGNQGKVKEVKVKVGDTVKKGDTLATYEVGDFNLQVKQAKLQYDNAKLALEELNSQKVEIEKKIVELDKQIKELSNSKNVNDLINLQLAKQARNSIIPISKERVEQAQNTVSLAKVALDTAESNLSKIKESIVADIDGVITKVSIENSSIDSGAQPAMVVQDLNNLKINTKISKYDLNRIFLGQPVEIKASNSIYKGVVSFINPIANKEASLSGSDVCLDVEIQVLEGASNLKVGFDVDVDILTNSIDDVLKIPAESIKSEKDGTSYVYIIENKKAIRKSVVLGIQSDMEAEVKSGISVGDKVILNPNDLIKDGTEVKI